MQRRRELTVPMLPLQKGYDEAPASIKRETLENVDIVLYFARVDR